MPPATAKSEKKNVQLSSLEKAAILVMYLDREAARAVLRHLSDDDVQKLGVTISSVREVDDGLVEQVVRDFLIDLRQASVLSSSGKEFARTVLPNLVDEDRRTRVAGAIRRRVDDDFASFIKSRPAAAIAAVLAEEHPQVQAVALLRMGPENAARVLALFEEGVQMDLTMRMARAEKVSGELADDVEAAMRRALADLDDPLPVGGVEGAARVLGRMPRDRNTSVLNSIREKENELADKLQRLMVVFDDLVSLEDRGIQALLRVVDRADLVLALKGASNDMRERFLKNLSSRAAQDLMEELEIATSVRKAQVREAQEKIVMAAQKLADEGVIMLGPETEEGA
ncbi:MAG TPA: flagellar motor switch protein FliG [Myxococcota bacterium]|nr:flagellar motor switch protein FliG [Myxococcota bacterium]HNH45527.1 flagellar motor switch protein FliG [Myxococcota bacterium]